jgi:hypothetical protein
MPPLDLAEQLGYRRRLEHRKNRRFEERHADGPKAGSWKEGLGASLRRGCVCARDNQKEAEIYLYVFRTTIELSYDETGIG